MEVALEVWSSDYEQVAATCRRAEELGLAGFYYGESPHDLNLDCWTTLAALAGSTERIRLGPVIANILPTYRSHLLLAKQAATTATVSNGRVDFRTGAGAASAFGRRWWEPFGVTYPDYEQRLADLATALEVLPPLWSVQRGPGHGAPTPAPVRIPITVAATGDRALRLAAASANVWETSFCTPAEFAERNAKLSAMVGDRPVARSLEIDGFVAPDDGRLRHLLDRVRSERGAAEDLAPVFDRALLGTPREVADRLEALATVGVDQVVVALHDPHDPSALEALAAGAALVAP